MTDLSLLASLTVAVVVFAKYAISRDNRVMAQQIAFFSVFVVTMA